MTRDMKSRINAGTMGLPAVLLAAGLLLTGCVQQPVAGPDHWVTARNAASDRCIAKQSENAVAGMDGSELYIIHCGRWPRISARLFVSTQRTQMEHWRDFMKATLACRPDKSRPVELAPALTGTVKPCNMLEGNWPYETLEATGEKQVFMADGQVGMVEPIKSLIRHVAGIEPITETSTLAEMARLSMAEGVGTGASIQRNAYLQLMQAGYDLMSTERYAEAEDAFRSAQYSYRAANSDSPPPVTEKSYSGYPAGILDSTLALSLALSNQEKVPEAEEELKRVRQLVERGERPLLSALYNAMLAANRRKPQEVEEHIAKAEALYLQEKAKAGKRRTAAKDEENARLARLGQGRDQLLILTSTSTTDAIDEQRLLERNMQTVRYLKAEWLRRRALREPAATRLHLLEQARVALEIPDDVRKDIADSNEIMGLTARTQGLLLLEAKDDGEAIIALDTATGLFQRLVGAERPYAVTLLRRGAAHLKRKERARALTDFTDGVKALKEARQTVSYELVEPYLNALAAESEGQPDARKAALAVTMLEATQVTVDGVTARSLADAAARQLENPEARAAWRRKTDLESGKNALLQDLGTLEKQPAGPARLAQENAIQQQITVLDEALKKAKEDLQKAAPYYFKLQEPVDLEKLRETIGPTEAAALFLLGETQTYGFLVGKDHIKVWRTPLGEGRARELVDAVLASVNDFGGLDAFDVSSARELYSGLFGEHSQKHEENGDGVARLAGIEDLLMVVNGPLSELPMGVLVTEQPHLPGGPEETYTLEQMQHIPWLLRRASVAHFPSLQTLGQTRLSNRNTKKEPPPLPYIGFADAVPPSEAQIQALGADCKDDQAYIGNLPTELDGTVQEINLVADIINKGGAGGAEVVTGAAFTRDKLEKDRLSKYRIIHFATHAMMAKELPCIGKPAIQISTPPDASDAKEGLLLQDQVEGLELNADLVVLSACNTAGAQAEQQEGEELIQLRNDEGLTGLTRGFLYAGARGVIVSYWPAKDAVAPRLMEMMFQNLRTESAARALRDAQMNILGKAGTSDKWPPLMAHPFAWATFAVVGDGPLPTTTDPRPPGGAS
ncbi:CHAT domain-containing protein [Niveispirillum sp. KHB5.9]|uniref:CHAT domain-containing protein n=1 Tax=Niveispirillum sp. KHB5.9 TaxID=3400269 RepID=UPI003A89BA9F